MLDELDGNTAEARKELPSGGLGQGATVVQC